MVKINLLVIAALHIGQVRADSNILLNKSSKQSNTFNSYVSDRGNDGNTETWSTSSTSNDRLDPFWQGDLEGFYLLHNISLTSAENNWENSLRKAFVGVSVHDVDCSGGQVTMCGQWPDSSLEKHTIVFNCSHAGPVRFVRIWRELTAVDFLSFREVEAEGETSSLPESLYHKVKFQKVMSATTSLTASSVTGCANMCLQTQPCLAFSYSTSEQPNCLLASDVTMTSDVNWDGYRIAACF